MPVNRRNFLKGSAAGATALTLAASSYAEVKGANDAVRVGFLGVGGRCQQHVDVILQLQEEKKGVKPVVGSVSANRNDRMTNALTIDN